MRTHRLRDALVGLGYIVVIAALITTSVLIYNKTFANSVDITLNAGDVGPALQTGADVEVRGIVVGSVTSITSTGTGAQVKMAVDPGQAKRLPANVTAQVLPKTLFGQRYVALVLPATASGTLHNGQVIQPSSAAAPTELEDVFTHLLPVLQAVRPAKLAETLGAIAASVRDRGTEIGQTIDLMSKYLKRFAPKVPAMVRDIDQFASVAKTYQVAAPDLLSALRNFAISSRTLVQERSQFIDLLHTVTVASNRFGKFMQANSQDLIDLSRDSLPSLRVLAHYSGEFPCLSRALADFIPVMNKTLGKGTNEPGLHVRLQVVPARSAYAPGDSLRYSASGGPSCPGGGSELTTSTGAGSIGMQNSPEENEVIAELMAGSVGTTPQRFPHWGSLLLGPALRGTTVAIK